MGNAPSVAILKLAGTTTKFESKPLVPLVKFSGSHGAKNADCVAVWFPWVKLNRTRSPNLAVIWDGVNTEEALLAEELLLTLTTIVCDEAAADDVEL